MDDPTPDQKQHWTNKKHIVHEEDIISKLPTVLIGADTILRDNPPSYPVQDGRESREMVIVRPVADGELVNDRASANFRSPKMVDAEISLGCSDWNK